jgi:hypothetical protein
MAGNMVHSCIIRHELFNAIQAREKPQQTWRRLQNNAPSTIGYKRYITHKLQRIPQALFSVQ